MYLSENTFKERASYIMNSYNDLYELTKPIESKLSSNIKDKAIERFLTDFIDFKNYQVDYISKISSFYLLELHKLKVGQKIPFALKEYFNSKKAISFNVYTENYDFSLSNHTLWIYRDDNNNITDIDYSKIVMEESSKIQSLFL